MKIRVIVIGLLFFCIQFGAQAAPFAESKEYYALLKSAFQKIIPRERDPKIKDPTERLMEAILRGSEGIADRDQVLEVAAITTLTAFPQALNRLLAPFREAIQNAEEQSKTNPNSFLALPNLKHDYRLRRLTPKELAVIIHFYKNIDSKRVENSLVRNHGLLKIDTETARQAIEATAFPIIEIRSHDNNFPQIEYTDEIRREWIEIGLFFIKLELHLELLQIHSQLVNQEAGHLKYRHLRSFEERFLLAVRKLALEKNEHFEARDLLLAYLSNLKSAKFLATHPELFKVETGLVPKRRNRETLAFFMIRLSEIKNRDTLAKFFEDGSLPRTFQMPKSVQAQRIIHTYNLAAKEEGYLAEDAGSEPSCAKRLKVLSVHHMHELDNHLAKFRT